MPREIFGEGFSFLDRKEILSFEEIIRLVRIFIGLGVEKVRLTGGEPLLRKDLPKLVAGLGASPVCGKSPSPPTAPCSGPWPSP